MLVYHVPLGGAATPADRLGSSEGGERGWSPGLCPELPLGTTNRSAVNPEICVLPEDPV